MTATVKCECCGHSFVIAGAWGVARLHRCHRCQDRTVYSTTTTVEKHQPCRVDLRRETT